MGFVSSMLGSSSGAGFQAVAPDPAQLKAAYNQTQSGIAQQQDFLKALQAQNGLANQSSVFNQQQGLANQLQGVANGTGPNPAQAALNQSTGQNVANQAALMAGQRGAGANTGLIARQAAMQGANTQQQAAGQGATMQAQQQLAGMQQLQNQQASMGNLANTQVNQTQAGLTGLNQNSLQQQANLMGLQANANSANAGIAGINAGGQQNLLGGMMGAVGSVGQLFGGGKGSSTPGGSTGPIDTSGGAVPAAGDTLQFSAEGGMIHGYADGGEAFDPMMQTPGNQEVSTQNSPQIQGPQSNVGKMFNTYEGGAPKSTAKSGNNAGMGAVGSGIMKMGAGLLKNQGFKELGNFFGDMFGGAAAGAGNVAGGAGDAISGGAASIGAPEGVGEAATVAVAAHGGEVPALVSKGENYLNPKAVNEVKHGANPLKVGERIPGKPKYPGNDYRNDVVRRDLDEGGIVIPNKIMQAPDAEKKAAQFVAQILAKNNLKRPK